MKEQRTPNYTAIMGSLLAVVLVVSLAIGLIYRNRRSVYTYICCSFRSHDLLFSFAPNFWVDSDRRQDSSVVECLSQD